MAIKISQQMTIAAALFESAGRAAGLQWGNAFTAVAEQGVAPYLIDMLVNLVTPGVMARMAQAGTAEGAQ